MSLSDAKALAAIRESDNMLVPWYLMASYAYYILDKPIISDGLFETICQRLDKKWGKIEHQHKHWINRDDLVAGTRLDTSYPPLVMGAASALAGAPYRGSWSVLDDLAACENAVERLCLILNRR